MIYIHRRSFKENSQAYPQLCKLTAQRAQRQKSDAPIFPGKAGKLRSTQFAGAFSYPMVNVPSSDGLPDKLPPVPSGEERQVVKLSRSLRPTAQTETVTGPQLGPMTLSGRGDHHTGGQHGPRSRAHHREQNGNPFRARKIALEDAFKFAKRTVDHSHPFARH